MLDDLKAELELLSGSGALRAAHLCDARGAGRIKTRGREVIDFCNWDILDLSLNVRVKRGAQVEIEQSGVSARSSRISYGSTAAHVSCEDALARFLNREASLIFSSRNQVVFSLITALFNECDVIFAEETLSGPIADAAYIIGARLIPFSAQQLEELETELLHHQSSRRRAIFSESISGITAVGCDYSKLLSVAEKYGAALFLDDSFALGIAGLRGAGSAERLSPSAGFVAQYGDLALGLGSFGSFVASSRLVIGTMLHRSRTIANEIAVPPLFVSSLHSALAIAETSLGQRTRASELATRLESALLSAGCMVGKAFNSPFLALKVDSLSVANEICEALFQKGFLVECVPRGTIRDPSAYLRIIVHSAHTEVEIVALTQNLVEILKRIKRA